MYRDPHQVSEGARRASRARASDALYVISVAARLVEMHPTTLRKYERVGFLEPSRTPGRTRLYSREDIRRLRQIKALVEEHEMNLAGVIPSTPRPGSTAHCVRNCRSAGVVHMQRHIMHTAASARFSSEKG